MADREDSVAYAHDIDSSLEGLKRLGCDDIFFMTTDDFRRGFSSLRVPKTYLLRSAVALCLRFTW